MDKKYAQGGVSSFIQRAVLFITLLSFLVFTSQPVRAQETPGPIYVVQPGDSLSSIASRFGVTLQDLMAANNITDPNQLTAGEQLVIPGMQGVTGVLNTVFINFGDSYRSLMRRTQVPQELFRKLNHVLSPSEFYVGASMIVPAAAGSHALTTRLSPAAGESLLEVAIAHNSDPWTLAYYNGLHGTWDTIAGDTFFAPGDDTETQASGLPSAFISAELRDLPVKQGGTSVIAIKTEPGTKLSGVLIDHQLHFFSEDDGTQIALHGVYALLAPGVYPLQVDATLADGTRQSYEQPVLVISGGYPEDPLLYVDPGTIDPAVTEPELQQLVDITLPATETRYWSGDFISPAIAYAASTYFTSRFGNRRTYIGAGTDLKVQGFHTGLDFGGGTGLPITAPAAGKVVFAGPLTVRGNATIIDHGWGVYSGIWHQSKFDVQVGDIVQRNQVIGEVGGTGRATGPHLHWEVWVNGVQVDPLDWLTNTYP